MYQLVKNSILLWLIISSFSFSYDVTKGENWLINQINTNQLEDSSGIALSTQSTKQSVLALKQRAKLITIDESKVLMPFVSTDTNTTEFLTSKSIVRSFLNQEIQPLLDTLRTLQNSDGGYGYSQDYESTALYTAIALETMLLDGTKADTPKAINYLISLQKSDGSWKDSEGEKLYTTALVLRALWLHRKSYDVLSTLDKAKDYLYTLQNANGSYGDEIFQSALVLRSIAPLAYDKASLQSTIDYLKNTQQSNGSWLDDIYTTALCLQALHVADKNVPNPDLATLSGMVVDGDTGVALSGMTIALTDEANVTTKSDGLFHFSGLKNGSYMLDILSDNYALLHTMVRLVGDDVDLGRLRLSRDVNATISVLKGTVKDKKTSLPLSAVKIMLDNREVYTDSNGSYLLDTVEAGTHTVTVSKAGYIRKQQSINIPANTIMHYNLLLGSIDFSVEAIAKGRVIDGNNSMALTNVIITLSGAKESTFNTDTNGTFNFSKLGVGEYKIVMSKAGYRTVSSEFSVTHTNVIDYGDIVLEALSPADTSVIVRGIVTDALENTPMEGVTVKVGTKQAITDSHGSYEIRDIEAGTLHIEASKEGYGVIVADTNASEGAVLIFSPLLSSKDSNETTTISGMVVDTSTDIALKDVEFYINGVNTGIKSDENGTFFIDNISITDINLTLKLAEYKVATSLILLQEAQVIDMGSLRMRANFIEEYKPDLVVEAINTVGLIGNVTTLEVNGELNVTVVNRGTVPATAFDMLLFYDVNADRNYTEGLDKKILVTRIEDTLDVDASSKVTLNINTIANFRDQPIYVYVDSKNENVELDENNTFSTAKSCGGKQGQIDLGVCFDYSGSVTSYIPIQKAGLIEALRNPEKFPRDGSIRLMVLVGAYTPATYLEPTVITSSNIDSIADKLENNYFVPGNGSDFMGKCLKKMADTWEDMNDTNQSTYRAVTLSGDGVWGPSYGNINRYIMDRDYAVEHGINVIDTIGIGNPYKAGLEAYAYPQPAGGDLGKVYYAKTSEDIANSLITTFQKQTKIADLTLGKLKIIDNGIENNISIQFVVGNAGVATISKDINISIYKGTSEINSTLLRQISLDENISFGMKKVFTVDNLDLREGDDIYIVGDVENHLVECTKENNYIVSIGLSALPNATIQTTTNKLTYFTNEKATLTALSTNLGKLDANLTAQLILEDAQGNVIETFDARALGVLASQDSKSISNEWNTTNSLVGTYTARGILTNSKGVVVDESTSSFSIVSSGVTATLDLRLDKQVYHTTDSVGMDNFVQSITTNSIINDATIEVQVKDSKGTVVHTQQIDLGHLLPNVSRDVAYGYDYVRLHTGAYHVDAVLMGDNNVTYATDSQNFSVMASVAQGMRGSVALAYTEAHVGTAQTCSYSVTNLGTTTRTDLPLQLRVTDMNTSAVVYAHNTSLTLESTQTKDASKILATTDYHTRTYSCGLYAQEGTTWLLLDHRLFTLTNIAPQVQSQTLITKEDVGLNIVLKGSDEDNDTLAYTLLSQPTHGTLNGTAPTLYYVPFAHYVGADSFSFKVSDGVVDSAMATVQISITAKVINPDATDDKITHPHGSTITLDVLENDNIDKTDVNLSTMRLVDSNGALVTQIIVSSMGIWQIDTEGNVGFTPYDGYVGDPTPVVYRVEDYQGESISASVYVDYPPVAYDDNATTVQNKSIEITLLSNDKATSYALDPESVRLVEGNASTIELSSEDKGIWQVNTDKGSVTFTPDVDYVGQVKAHYRVRETQGQMSNVAQIEVNVEVMRNPTPTITPMVTPVATQTPTATPVPEPMGATPYWEVNDSCPKGDNAGVDNLWVLLLMLLGTLSVAYISQEKRRGN